MKKLFLDGLWRKNPVFVLLLGMCPTLGVTTSLLNGLGMGIATMAVLIMSNILISLLNKLIPVQVKVLCYLVLIATCVSVVEFLMQAYVPSLYLSLGIFVPLIVINCLILSRAELFASQNNVWLSFLDAVFMGLGFTLALTLLGAFREILSNGAIAGYKFLADDVPTVLFFIMPPGAFLALAGLIAGFNKIKGAK
ncbi:MAG: electron transport complex subunit E [Alphaproteobacteria bacterium]